MSAGALITAFFLSLIGCGLMTKIGISDTPNARSIHIRPTPTAGGAAIFIALIGAFVFTAARGEPLFGDDPKGLGAATLLPIFACLTLIGGIGFLDDIYRFGVKSKMAAMIIAAAISAAMLGPVPALPLGADMEGLSLPIWLGYLGAGAWIFAVMNVVNFTDGANGFIGLTLGGALVSVLLFLFMLGGLSAAPVAMVWASVLLAGIAGFLPFNARPKAALFAGDIGALVIGYLYAVIVLLLVSEVPATGGLYLGPLFILPLLADVFITLIRRIKAGHNPLVAHKDHIFQRLISSGHSHLAVGGVYLLAGLALAAAGIGAEHLGLSRSPLIIIAPSLFFVSIYYILFRKTQP
jgi:UDP-N-acetylmuramyl pentapeptide phosphotransferase/UDP-N-acetylglucosamine-1-phosphate transferase